MSVRDAACAGSFYPADPFALRAAISHYAARSSYVGEPPIALIAPHAAWSHCGETLATALCTLAGSGIGRVIHLGPSHHLPLDGIVASGVERFRTPLGVCRVEPVAQPAIAVNDAAHSEEHALEVQLPFLQACLARFDYVPLLTGGLAGGPEAEHVATVLEGLGAGSAGTLLLVSSDLSHGLAADTAVEQDLHTLRRLEALGPMLTDAQACGAAAINGLNALARRRSWRGMALARTDSTTRAGGPAASVVGYGAMAYYPKPS